MKLSLRYLTALAFALVSVLTAIIAFTPTYLTGVDGVMSTVQDLRATLARRAFERTGSFFDVPRSLAFSFNRMSAGALTDLTNNTDLIRTLCSLLAVTPSVSIVNFAFLTPIRVAVCDDRFPIGLLGGYLNGTGLKVDYADPVTLAPNGTTYVFLKNYHLVFPTLAASMLVRFNSSFQVAWLPGAAIGYNSVQLSVVARVFTPTGGDASVTFGVLPGVMQQFLGSLGLRRRARALIVDVLSQVMLANSWGEDNQVLLPQWADISLPAAKRMKTKTIINMTDSLIGSVYNILGSALFNASTPFSTDLTVGSVGVVYVDVLAVSDGLGLNIRLLLAMPEADFTDEIVAQRGRTIGGVVGAIVGLMLLGALLAHLMMGPLNRIAYRMELCSRLADDEPDDPPSALAEVNSMQESYVKMKNELNRAKAYLPQSLLHQGEDEDSGDEGAGEDGGTNSAAAMMRSTSATSAVDTPLPETTPGAELQAAHRASRLSASASHAGAPKAGDAATRHSNESRTKAGAVPRALNTKEEVNQKTVTIAVFNMKGTHDLVADGVGRFVRAQGAMLDCVTEQLRAHKGVVDHFHGDHIVASFNAVNNCVAQQKRAAFAAYHAVQRCTAAGALLTIGVSSGPAAVGNMGTTSMRRFCVIGPVFVQAMALERLCSSRTGCNVLMIDKMAAEVGLEMNLQMLDVVIFPGEKCPTLVASVVGPKSVQMDEWMYQLEEGEKGDPFTEMNAVMAALCSNDVAAARLLLAKHEEQTMKRVASKNAMKNNNSASIAAAHLAICSAVGDTVQRYCAALEQGSTIDSCCIRLGLV